MYFIFELCFKLLRPYYKMNQGPPSTSLHLSYAVLRWLTASHFLVFFFLLVFQIHYTQLSLWPHATSKMLPTSTDIFILMVTFHLHQRNIHIVLASVILAWHKLELPERGGPQLRKWLHKVSCRRGENAGTEVHFGGGEWCKNLI